MYACRHECSISLTYEVKWCPSHCVAGVRDLQNTSAGVKLGAFCEVTLFLYKSDMDMLWGHLDICTCWKKESVWANTTTTMPLSSWMEYDYPPLRPNPQMALYQQRIAGYFFAGSWIISLCATLSSVFCKFSSFTRILTLCVSRLQPLRRNLALSIQRLPCPDLALTAKMLPRALHP